MTVAPPQNVEAEQSVLGAVLLADTALAGVLEQDLRPEHFYRESHGRIFRTMLDLRAAGEPVDVLTLVERLKGAGELDAVGGRAAIDLLSGSVPAVGNVRDYARIVVTTAQERRVRVLAAEVANGNGASEDLRRELRRALEEQAAAPTTARPAIVTAGDFLARPRQELEPFVATTDRHTTLLARETTLLVAGPSGVGKSLAASFDLAGRLARDHDSDWLGLRVRARRRVLLLPFEGSDEDTAERARALIPEDARSRFALWDRWAPGARDLPRADEPGVELLARTLRELEIDVLVIDTATAYFGGDVAVSVAAGEGAHAVLEDLRARSGRRFAAIVVLHTKKADRGGAKIDELEEISGTLPRKADSAIVIRSSGQDESDPRRTVAFAKVRRGPKPRTKIATLPTDPDAAPRLELVADAGAPMKEGTEPQAMLEWIKAQDGPVVVAALCARFSISEATLRQRRRPELEALGVRRGKVPGQANTYAYGTDEQWRSLELGGAA